MGAVPPIGRLRLIAQRLVGERCRTASEAAARMTCMQAQLGVPAKYRATMERDEEAARSALSGARSLARRELVTALAEAGADTTGQAAAHRLLRLALGGVICMGPMLARTSFGGPDCA